MGGKKDFVARIEAMMDPALVWIDEAAIARLDASSAAELAPEAPPPAAVQGERATIWFAVAMNAINHQFWDVVDGKFERYVHRGSVGAVAMREGLSAMVEDAGSIQGLAARLPLKATDIERWFGPIPDPEGRARALGDALGRKGRACADLLADSSHGGEPWGIEHARAIALMLPSGYEDPLLKKAQLCMWMAKGMLEAQGIAAPEVDSTAFADYQIPKVLRGLGVLGYGEELAAKVDAGCVLEEDGPMEVAIRAATVVACEKISQSKSISAPALDFWLWSRRDEFAEPFHRVRTMRY